MATLQDARTQWVAENPIGSPGYDLSQAEYDALADDRAQLVLVQMEQQEAHTAAINEIAALVEQVPALLTRADTLGTATGIPAIDLQHDVADLMRLSADLITVLNRHSREPQPVEG
jgi:hypothetical protein